MGQSPTFDGTTLQLIGWRLLGLLLSAITLGIAAPWATCMIYRWQAKHTLVEGQRLHFDGKGHQLLGHYLLWGLLILITFGIYTIFLPVQVRKWHVKHLSFATGTGAIQRNPFRTDRSCNRWWHPTLYRFRRCFA